MLFALPEGKRMNMQKEAKHQASLDGPKVLAELLAEVRLLRMAVERLASE